MIKVTVSRAKKNPSYVRVVVDTKKLRGESLPIHLGLHDNLDLFDFSKLWPETKLHRKDGKKTTFKMRRDVIDATRTALLKIKVESQSRLVRTELALLETRNMWFDNYFKEIKAKQRKRVTMRDLADDGKKMDLRYIRKAGRYVIDEIEGKLKGKVPDEVYSDFIESWANTVHGWEKNRSRRYSLNTKLMVNQNFLPDALASQIGSAIKRQGGASVNAVAGVQKAMEGMSDLAVLVAGVKSGYISHGYVSHWQVSDSVQHFKNISSGEPAELKMILKTLNTVKRMRGL